MTRSTLLGELRGFMQRASDDELRAFHVIASRVMGGGRDQYGPLHLANDARNFAKEAADEAADLLWYQAIRVVLDGYAAPVPVSPIPPSAGAGAAPINRLGRACTDCGASDGDAHAEGCGWITEVR